MIDLQNIPKIKEELFYEIVRLDNNCEGCRFCCRYEDDEAYCSLFNRNVKICEVSYEPIRLEQCKNNYTVLIKDTTYE